jgi:hypothetical protein
MSIFDFSDYKSAIKWSLEDLKKRDPRANSRALAEACRVQKTYLSRVLNRDAHLNADQLHLANQYLELNLKERKYVSLIHEADRSVLVDRKEALLREATKLKAKAQNTENFLSAESLDVNALHASRYYLDVTMQLVHLFWTIPRYAKNPRLIEEKLDIARIDLEERLAKLAGLKIITWDGKKCTVIKGLLHLSRDSEVYPVHRVLTRIKALEKLQKSTSKKDYSYSLLMSADEATRKMVHSRFLEFLKGIEPLIKAAPESEVYQLNFDLLSWSDR